MKMRLWLLGVFALALEVAGILLLAYIRFFAQVIYFAGFGLMIVYTYSLRKTSGMFEYYFKFISSSFAILFISMILYIILHIIFPRSGELLINAFMASALLVPSILYGLSYISLFQATELGLEPFLYGIAYIVLGATNVFLLYIPRYWHTISFYLMVIVIALKTVESHIVWRISCNYTCELSKQILASIIAIVLLSSSLAFAPIIAINSAVYAGDQKLVDPTNNLPGGAQYTLLFYLGSNEYSLLISRAMLTGQTYQAYFIPVKLQPPITFMVLNGYYEPIFSGAREYFGVLSPETVFLHYHFILEYDPNSDENIGCTILLTSMNNCLSQSYVLRETVLTKPLMLKIRIREGRYIIRAILVTHGDKLCDISLYVSGRRLVLSPNSSVLLENKAVDREKPVYVTIVPACPGKLNYRHYFMEADLMLFFYRTTREPIPGILVVHYSFSRYNVLPLDAGIIIDAFG